ncbi:small ribosomal subunit protein uS14-like [Symphalangus syndactylus]|uniref:small ribosomal subunit protein uS14-like n=1 Tax=Symphalangus syndactylus TaxID=9590 RepID=UPI0024419041|nr:40S ribosomal protein S29-like [Symphalangus syndactylus]
MGVCKDKNKKREDFCNTDITKFYSSCFLLPRCTAESKIGHQQLYWSHPRKFGQGSRSCRVCSNRHDLIRKYGLNMCRQCFRQYAKDIGFIKLD